MSTPASGSRSPLWAITSYFNPFRGRRRRSNYARFRARLGVPLLTVEWSPQGDFELGEGDAERLVQVRGGDILWQKDRLLNLALQALPPGCDAVAALDCDVLFGNPDWAACTLQVLREHAVAQVFEQVHYLAAFDGDTPCAEALPGCRSEERLPALAAALAAGRGLYHREPGHDTIWHPATARLSGNPGLGLAYRTAWLRRCGFYDANAVGGADLVMFSSMTGHLDQQFAARAFSPAHQRHIRAWAATLPPLGPQGVGVVPGELYHLWHGELVKRQYVQRYALLAEQGYDPAQHLRLGEQGVWHWTPAGAAIAQKVRDHLRGREDA